MSTDPREAARALRRQQIRRRRATAGACLLILVVVLVVAIAGGGGGGGSRRSLTSLTPGRLLHSKPAATLAAKENAAITTLVDKRGFITAGSGRKREIALTFDDGPGPYTYRLLQVIKRLHVPATFFEIGEMMHYFNDPLQDELATRDVVIGDHTETHPMMARLNARAQQAEILEQSATLTRYGGPFPRLYRPPYGSFNATTFKILRRYKMLMVLWTVDTNDYREPGVRAIVDAVVDGSKPGAIILMHDAGGDRIQTIEALPLIVRALRARHYKLVTVPQLVLDDPPPANQPLPQNLSGG